MNLASAVAIKLFPEFFIDHNGHLALIGLQGLGLLGNLIYIIRSFSRITPLILAARAE